MKSQMSMSHMHIIEGPSFNSAYKKYLNICFISDPFSKHSVIWQILCGHKKVL